jgi:hypothetical protein
MLEYLFDSGMLDGWREGNEPVEIVFEVGAIFRMEQGVQGFSPAEFIDRLHSERQ